MSDMDLGIDMDEEIFELVDDEGNTVPFALLDVLEFEDDTYLALEAIDEEDAGDEEGEVVFMLVTRDEEGEDCYEPVEDDDLCERLFDLYLKHLDEAAEEAADGTPEDEV